MLPFIHSNRTCSISETCLTSLWEEHQEAQEAQEAQGDPEDPAILLEAQERYPPLISFPSNPQETSNLWAFPPSSLMVTEREPTHSSKNCKST